MSSAITGSPGMTGASEHERCPNCGEAAEQIVECGECAVRMCDQCAASKGLCESCDVDLHAGPDAFGACASASYNDHALTPKGGETK